MSSLWLIYLWGINSVRDSRKAISCLNTDELVPESTKLIVVARVVV